MNCGLDIQFLRPFHECNLYGYLTFYFETSKQLKHPKIVKCCENIEKKFSNLKEYTVIAKALSFCREILHGPQMLACYKYGYPKAFPHLLSEMAIPPVLIWISCSGFVRRCDFSGFSFRRLLVNHLNKIFDICYRSCNTLFNLC